MPPLVDLPTSSPSSSPEELFSPPSQEISHSAEVSPASLSISRDWTWLDEHPDADYEDTDTVEIKDDKDDTHEITADFECFEPCCTRWKHNFGNLLNLNWHVHSYGHIWAAKEGYLLRSRGAAKLHRVEPAEMQLKQKAMRELRCDLEDCECFGRKFKSARQYFEHYESDAHHRARG